MRSKLSSCERRGTLDDGSAKLPRGLMIMLVLLLWLVLLPLKPESLEPGAERNWPLQPSSSPSASSMSIEISESGKLNLVFRAPTKSTRVTARCTAQFTPQSNSPAFNVAGSINDASEHHGTHRTSAGACASAGRPIGLHRRVVGTCSRGVGTANGEHPKSSPAAHAKRRTFQERHGKKGRHRVGAERSQASTPGVCPRRCKEQQQPHSASRTLADAPGSCGCVSRRWL
jgi:hypothetical protein